MSSTGSPRKRRRRPHKLCAHLAAAANAASPWATFADQQDLWGREGIVKLAHDWPELAAAHMSIGDAMIKEVAEYYARSGHAVQILTGDQGLKVYQPQQPATLPRRRRFKSAL